MADNPITVRRVFGPNSIKFEHFSAAAITAAADKQQWIATEDLRIVDVICASGGAGSGANEDIIDVNINGVTIYTTQGNRPTLVSGDTGMFEEANEPEITRINVGDVISYDVDGVAAGGGSTLFKITILCVKR